MRKEVKAAVAVILAIWFFVMGFEIGVYKERKAHASQASVTTTGPVAPSADAAPTESTQQSPVAPTALTPSGNATNPTTPSANNSNATQQSSKSEDVSKLSKDEIVSRTAAAMTALKAEPNFTANKKMQVTITVVDCSVPSVINQINDIINGIVDDVPAEETLVFVNGVATNSNGEQVTAKDTVPPDSAPFALTSTGVSSAKAEKQGDNTVYTLQIVSEDTTGENPVPPHNSASVGYLDITSLGLPSIVKITKANMHYPGSTVKVTVNKDGKVIAISNRLPMTGEGEASVLGVGGNASFEGGLNEDWTITY